MKIKKRIVPFTTLLLTNRDNFTGFVIQAMELAKSDSFNPQGRIYVIDCDEKTVSVVSREKEKKVKKDGGFSSFEIFKFIWKIKPSLGIDFCRSNFSRFLLFFSRAGRTSSKFSLFSLIFTKLSYVKKESSLISTAAPYMFNQQDGERFGYRYTKCVSDTTNPCSDINSDEIFNIDLGRIPKNPKKTILWVPRRGTIKNVWQDFIFLTFYAQKHNATIDVHFRSKKDQRSFNSVFFIKGRKMDLDNYLSPLISSNIYDLYQPKKANKPPLIVFSFGMTPEYRNTRLNLLKLSPETKLTTIIKLRRARNV